MSSIDLETLWRLVPEAQTWPDAENVTPVEPEDTEDVEVFLASLNPLDVPLLIRLVMWAAQGAILGSLISGIITVWRSIF